MPVAGAIVAGAIAGAVAGSVADKTIEEVVPGLGGGQTVTASEPSIVIIEMPTANKEEELRIPSWCKKFMLQMRDGTTFKIATVKNGTKSINANYFTVRTDGVVWWDGLNVVNPKEAVFYIACGGATKVAEIWQWS